MVPESLLDNRCFGVWKVEGFLAEGGMARVWRVRHTETGVLGALKVSRSRDPELLARAAREGRIQSLVRHPNVLAALDIVEVDGTPGIVLEFLEGGLTLDTELERGRMVGSRLDAAVNAVLDGVEAAHRAGYIHRDLKPANVLLAQRGEEWVPQIADFGLARPEFEPPETKLTRAGYILGSAAYMAPEQARDAGSVDARADIWSLGCVIYEMVTGEPAFGGDSIDEVLINAGHARFRPLDSHVPDVEARWQVGVEACLHVDPEMRAPDVATLRAILRGERRWVSEGGGARGRSNPGAPSPMRQRTRKMGDRSGSETFVGDDEPEQSAATVRPGPSRMLLVGGGVLAGLAVSALWWSLQG